MKKWRKKNCQKLGEECIKKWDLIDCLIIHRYGKLYVNEKIVL